MHDDDLTPEEQKVKAAKEFLDEMREADPDAADHLLKQRYHEQLDKVIDELYGDKREQYISILQTDVADMDYRDLKKLQGLVALYLVAMSIGRIRKRIPSDSTSQEEEKDGVYQWCRDIIEGCGGMNDYEHREVVEWDKPIRVAAAEWTIRCLANIRSEGSEEVFQRISRVRAVGNQALKAQLDKQRSEQEVSQTEEKTDDIE